MPVTFGPDAANENERRREMAIFGHVLPIQIAGYGDDTASPQPHPRFDTKGLIDTGASDVCIDYRIALELGLRAVDQSNVGVVGGTTLATIYLGRLVIPSLGFDRVMPLYALRVRHPTHEVLLGRSFLQNYIVIFDGPAGMFHFATRDDHHVRGAIEDDFAT